MLALKQVGGDLSGGQSKLRAALNSIGKAGPEHARGLRQARPEPSGDRQQLPDPAQVAEAAGDVSDDPDDPERHRVVRRVLHDLDADAVADVPAVRQEEAAVVGRSLQVRAAEEVERLDEACRVAVTQEATQSAEPILRLRGVGRRFGGLRRRPRRRPRRRARRAPGDPRPERRREDDAVQRHRRRLPGHLRADRALRTRTSRCSPRGIAPSSASRGPTSSRGSSPG